MTLVTFFFHPNKGCPCPCAHYRLLTLVILQRKPPNQRPHSLEARVHRGRCGPCSRRLPGLG